MVAQKHVRTAKKAPVAMSGWRVQRADLDPLKPSTSKPAETGQTFTRQWGTPGSQWVNHSLKNYVSIN